MAAVIAHAEPYIGASGGRSESDLSCSGFDSCDKRSGAWTVRGGYHFSPYVSLEARYVDLGTSSFNTASGSTNLKGDGTGVDAVFSWPFYDRWNLSGMLGVGRMTAKATGDIGGSGSSSSTKPWFGVALGYDVGFNVIASVEAERYRIPAAGDSANVDLITVGLTYNFR
jgi:hypothetical protein